MKTRYAIMLLAASSVMLSSCASMGSLSSVRDNQANVATQSFAATVVSAYDTKIETSSTSKSLGTGIGAVLGAGAGQLLGGGSGRIVSALGFGAAGALAGRYLTDSMGNTLGQTLTVQVDGSSAMYTVTQPVYEEIGRIPVGAHGIFHLGGNNSRFVPDSM